MSARGIFKWLMNAVVDPLTKLMPWDDDIEEQIIAGAIYIIDEQIEYRGGWDVIDVYVEGRLNELGKSMSRKSVILEKVKRRYDPKLILDKL